MRAQKKNTRANEHHVKFCIRNNGGECSAALAGVSSSRWAQNILYIKRDLNE